MGLQAKENYIKPNFTSPDLGREIIGVVQGTRDRHGFVLREDGADIFLPPTEMEALLHQDKVRVRVLRYDKKGRPEGRVLEVLERGQRLVVGRLIQEKGVFLVQAEDVRMGQDILIPAKSLRKAKVGQIVVAEITGTPVLHTQPMGKIQEVLGEIDDPGMEIEMAVRRFELPHRFSSATLKAVDAIPQTVQAKEHQGRVDLRDIALLTIDGEDARDFDDAVYCEPIKIGKRKAWRLLVAIADVSHYVVPGSSIDKDAYERATSVYFPRRVIPMLPEALSNGLCSLKPDVERLCMVCDMVIDTAGEIEAYQFFSAVMLSHARLTYTQAAAILENPKADKKQSHLVPHLQHLQEAFHVLQAARQTRGALEFDTTETQMLFDEVGRIQSIVPKKRNQAHRLIEEAMLAANVCAADFILRNDTEALFRIHDQPSAEKIDTLQKYLRALGLPFTLGVHPSPKDYQHIAEHTKERPDAAQVHMMLLRSMQQAVYGPENLGHFGLAYAGYTHFTSPIRRYPDLLVHRAIKGILNKKPYRINSKNADLTWEAAGTHTSLCERRADEASRDVESWLKCKWMQQHVGEEFTATVSSVTGFGLFLVLDDVYVDGLIHITELGKDYFIYDEVRNQLRGERSGVVYSLGSRLKVQVARVNETTRRIDLRPVAAISAEKCSKHDKRGKRDKSDKRDKRKTSS